MTELFQRTLWRADLLKKHPDVADLRLHWECDVRALMEKNAELRALKEVYPIQDFERLNMRKAFKGGLCLVGVHMFDSRLLKETLRAYYGPDAELPSTRATLVDITSQYPSYLFSEKCTGYYRTHEDR